MEHFIALLVGGILALFGVSAYAELGHILKNQGIIFICRGLSTLGRLSFSLPGYRRASAPAALQHSFCTKYLAPFGLQEMFHWRLQSS